MMSRSRAVFIFYIDIDTSVILYDVLNLIRKEFYHWKVATEVRTLVLKPRIQLGSVNR